MTNVTVLPSRLAIGMCGLTVGGYCAFTAFRNGQGLAPGIDGMAFGAAFAAVVIGSWFLLPLAADACATRAAALRAGWALCLAFVLVNAIGFTALHRVETVGGKANDIASYDTAIAALPSAAAELAAMKLNPRWVATAGCTNATAEQSKAFCDAIKAKQTEVTGFQVRINQGRAGSADAQAETIAWVMRLDSVTVGRALPIFMAVVLDIAASLFMFAALAPANARPVIDITPLVKVPEAEPEPTPKVIAPKPKAARKKKPKQITYQPAITDKLDGRKTAGMKRRSANENANFVSAKLEV